MPMETLSLENLKDVKGGLVALMLDKALTRMSDDLEAAPDIGEWRTVTLEIRAKPFMENMQLDRVGTEFLVKGKVPARVTSAIMHVRKDHRGINRMLFNPESLDNPDQLTLTDLPGVMDDAEAE